MGTEHDPHPEDAATEDGDPTDDVEELPPLKGLMDPESEGVYSPTSDADAPAPG